MTNHEIEICQSIDASVEHLRARTAIAATQELDEINAVITDAAEARNMIITRALQRRQEGERRVKWEEILPRCAEAREQYEAALNEFRPWEYTVVNARLRLSGTESQLADHINRPLSLESYPSQKEINQWNRRETELGKAVEQRKAELREAIEGQEVARLRGIRAKEEFARIAFQEGQLRPRENQQPKITWHRSPGELSFLR